MNVATLNTCFLVNSWLIYCDVSVMPEDLTDPRPLSSVQTVKELKNVKVPGGRLGAVLSGTIMAELRFLHPGVPDAVLKKAVANGGMGGYQATTNALQKLLTLRMRDFYAGFNRRESCLGNLFN